MSPQQQTVGALVLAGVVALVAGAGREQPKPPKTMEEPMSEIEKRVDELEKEQLDWIKLGKRTTRAPEMGRLTGLERPRVGGAATWYFPRRSHRVQAPSKW